MGKRFILALLAAFSASAHAQETPVYLECTVEENGQKQYPFFSGEFWSYLKIVPSSRKVYLWKTEAGGGYFSGGGVWLETNKPALSTTYLSHYEVLVTDKVFSVETEEKTRNRDILAYSGSMQVSRITGGLTIRRNLPITGVSGSKSGACVQAKDPDGIPAPATKF